MHIEILISAKEIQKKVKEIGKKITEEYKGKKLVIVGVLKGAIIFFADLIRYIELPIEVDFINVKSYFGGIKSTGKVVLYRDIQIDIQNKNVIIVDDIYDTGYTLDFIKTLLEKRNPLSVKICTLLYKERKHEKEIDIDYTLFKIPDKFVVGYGLDYNELYRNLPYVGILKSEE